MKIMSRVLVGAMGAVCLAITALAFVNQQLTYVFLHDVPHAYIGIVVASGSTAVLGALVFLFVPERYYPRYLRYLAGPALLLTLCKLLYYHEGVFSLRDVMQHTAEVPLLGMSLIFILWCGFVAFRPDLLSVSEVCEEVTPVPVISDDDPTVVDLSRFRERRAQP